jgi:hypothetical protein
MGIKSSVQKPSRIDHIHSAKSGNSGRTFVLESARNTTHSTDFLKPSPAPVGPHVECAEGYQPRVWKVFTNKQGGWSSASGVVPLCCQSAVCAANYTETSHISKDNRKISCHLTLTLPMDTAVMFFTSLSIWLCKALSDFL